MMLGTGFPPFTTADVPFLPDIDPIVIDLPMPPSANRMWRQFGKRIVTAPEYDAWKKRADLLVMLQGVIRAKRKIDGAFEAEITIKREGHRGDLSNREKAVLDYAQRIGLITDDKHCQRLVIEYGDAPSGCRLTLRPTEARR